MSIHKFRTAMIVEIEVEFEYEPESGPYHDQPHYPAQISIVDVKAIPPKRGSEEWDDLREECWDHIEDLRQQAEEEWADRQERYAEWKADR